MALENRIYSNLASHLHLLTIDLNMNASQISPQDRIVALAADYGEMTESFEEKRNMIKLLNEAIRIKNNKIKQLSLDLKRAKSYREQLEDNILRTENIAKPIKSDITLLRREFTQLQNDYAKALSAKEVRSEEIKVLNKEREGLAASIKRNEEETASIHAKTAATERDCLHKRMHYHSLVKRVSTNSDRLDLLQSMHKSVTLSIESSIDAYSADINRLAQNGVLDQVHVQQLQNENDSLYNSTSGEINNSTSEISNENEAPNSISTDVNNLSSLNSAAETFPDNQEKTLAENSSNSFAKISSVLHTKPGDIRAGRASISGIKNSVEIDKYFDGFLKEGSSDYFKNSVIVEEEPEEVLKHDEAEHKSVEQVEISEISTANPTQNDADSIKNESFSDEKPVVNISQISSVLHTKPGEIRAGRASISGIKNSAKIDEYFDGFLKESTSSSSYFKSSVIVEEETHQIEELNQDIEPTQDDIKSDSATEKPTVNISRISSVLHTKPGEIRAGRASISGIKNSTEIDEYFDGFLKESTSGSSYFKSSVVVEEEPDQEETEIQKKQDQDISKKDINSVNISKDLPGNNAKRSSFQNGSFVSRRSSARVSFTSNPVETDETVSKSRKKSPPPLARVPTITENEESDEQDAVPSVTGIASKIVGQDSVSYNIGRKTSWSSKSEKAAEFSKSIIIAEEEEEENQAFADM